MKFSLDFRDWPNYILALVTTLLVLFMTFALSEFFLGAGLGGCVCAR